MGKKNKQRRKAGRPAPAARPAAPAGAAFGAPGSFGAPYPPPREQPPQEVVADLVSTAIHAFAAGNHSGVQTAIEALVERPNLGGWLATTEAALTSYLTNNITAALQRGWQPAD